MATPGGAVVEELNCKGEVSTGKILSRETTH